MRRGSILVPLLLIAAGVILLFNNLGHLPWSVWGTLFRLWPVLLIALGLDILFGRSALRWALGIALVVLVVLAVLLALFGPAPVGPLETVRVPVGGATRAEVNLRLAVGNLVVRAGTDADLLVRGTVTALWPDRAAWTSNRSEGAERFSLTVDRRHGLPPAWWPERTQVTVEVVPSVPIALWATLGEGASLLDLSDLDLTVLVVHGGTGAVDLNLPARGRFTAEIMSGIGEVTVLIPSGLGAQIRVAEGSGPVDAPPDWARDGGLIVSPGYETATHRVEVALRAGSGRIAILSIETP
ncbi:MAG: DUF5668 domain-containing protein [Candidatus Bipolaricaulota bacterium]